MVFKCKSCGSNVLFDIGSQRLVCTRCGNSYDVEEYDVDDKKTFDVCAYRCRDCGATLITNDETEATAFCSYCGSSSIITERLENLKKPDRILPFTVTKEQCREAYLKDAKSTFLAPSWVKEEATLESFRPIYMPYWRYTLHADVEQTTIRTTSETKRDGDYLETTSTDTPMRRKAELTYAAETHDASKAFSDDIGKCIGFEVNDVSAKKEKPFHAGYLSGLYADMADDLAKTHEEKVLIRERALAGLHYDAEAEAARRKDAKKATLKKVLTILLAIGVCTAVILFLTSAVSNAVIQKYRNSVWCAGIIVLFFAVVWIGAKVAGRFPAPAGSSEQWADADGRSTIEIVDKELIYCPVWFMSRRVGNKVNYAAVNGCTGKVVADYPVSTGSFLTLAGVAAAAVFALLSLVLVLRPEPAFWVTAGMGAAGVIACSLFYEKLEARADSMGVSLHTIPRNTLLWISLALIGALALLLISRVNRLIYLAAALIGVIVIVNCLVVFGISKTLSGHKPPQLREKEGEARA